MIRLSAGKFKGRLLAVSQETVVRPTRTRLRSSVFDRLSHGGMSYPWEEVRVLDLFAGTGALGLEALSRGASWVTFCEKSPAVCKILTQNIAGLGVCSVTEVVRGDGLTFLEHPSFAPYHLVFCDPPYAFDLAEQTFKKLAQHNWLAPDACLVLERRVASTLPFLGVFDLQGRKKYGETEILFLQKKRI